MKGKLLVSIIVLISLFLSLTTLIFYANNNVQNNKTAALAPLVATSSSQTNTYLVKSTNFLRVDPGTYWYQNAQKKWVADTQFGRVIVENKNGFPTPTVIKERFDLSTFQIPSGTTFTTLDDSRRFTKGQLNETYIASEKDVEFVETTSFKGKGIEVEQGSKVVLLFESGYGYKHTTYEMYNTTAKLHRVMYLTPFNVYWTGKLLETKEIRATADLTTSVGKTHALKAEVRTKTGTGAWSIYYDKTTVTSETTWRSDNPSVVSVDSTGKITALKNGKATIHVNWQSSDGDYHITTKTVVTVKDAPKLDITGNVDMCFDRGSTALKALYNSEDSMNVTDLPSTNWSSNNTSIATVHKGIVTFKKVGEVIINVQYLEEKDNVTVRINDCTVPLVPKPIVPNNAPPTVDIITKKEIIVGNNVCINAEAIDTDGFITRYDWDLPSFVIADNDTNTSSVCGYFEEVGSKEITVTVTDNGDENGDNQQQGTDWHTVQVVTAPPQAYVQIGGTLKENRKITLTPQHAYGGNDVLFSIAPIIKQTLTIDAVKMENFQQVKVVQDISGNVTHGQIIEFLAKFTGQVKITRYVENNKGQSDTFTTFIDVAPDLEPYTAVNASETVFRDKYPDGSVYATINVRMDSNSLDNDVIQKNIFKYKYDKNNNGSFGDENWQTFYEGQLNTATFTTDKVGKYLICGQAWERFGQDTINQFVNLTFNENQTDLKFTDDTSCVTVEVKNIAPTVSFDLMEEKEIELHFHLDDSGLSREELETAINQYVKPSLAAENVKINYSIESTKYHRSPTLFLLSQPTRTIERSDRYWNDEYGGWDWDEYVNLTNNYFALDIKKKEIIQLPREINFANAVVDYDNNIYYTQYKGFYKWDNETRSIIKIADAKSDYSDQSGQVLTTRKYRFDKVFVGNDGKIYVVEVEDQQIWTDHHTIDNVLVYDTNTQTLSEYKKWVGSIFNRNGIFNGYRGVFQIVNGEVYVGNQLEGGLYPISITGGVNSIGGTSADYFVPTLKNGVVKQGYYEGNMYFKQSGIIANGVKSTLQDTTLSGYISGTSYDASPIIIPMLDDTLLINKDNLTKHVSSTTVNQNVLSSFGNNYISKAVGSQIYEVYPQYNNTLVNTILTVRGGDVYFYEQNTDYFAVKKYNIFNRNIEMVYEFTNADKNSLGYDSRFFEIKNSKTPILYDLNKLSDTIKETEWKTEDKIQKFFVNLSKDTIRGGNEVKNIVSELDENNINFISIDTNNTKAIAEAILNEMDLESTQITVDSINDKQTAMTSLANHLLAVLNDERVEVEVDAIGDSKATIRNELKKMNNVLKEYDVFANVIVKRNTNVGSVQFAPSKTTIALKKTTNSIDRSYIDAAKKSFAYGVIASNLDSNTVNNAINDVGKGKAINSTDWNTIQQNLAEYILNIVQGKTLEIHIYANDKYDLTAIQNLVNTQLVNKLAETSLEVERILVKPLSSNFNYTNYNFGAKQRFVVALTDNYSADFKTHFKAGNLITNSHFIAITDKQSAKDAANEIIQASMKKGTVIDYKSLQGALNSVGDYITDYLLNNQGVKERYITKSSLRDLQVSYLDYESDPKINEAWRFKQELSYFENEEGYSRNANMNLSSANITLDKVGRYSPTYWAQDDPTVNIPSNLKQAFDNYKMWSEPIHDLILYVHREPNAQFEIKVNKDTGEFTATSKAYDLDKHSINIGYGPGLQMQQWSYKKGDETEWITGLPPNPIAANTTYEVRNTVVDFQGKQSVTTTQLSRQNLPPVANFVPNKVTFKVGDTANFTNLSYDPNNDNLVSRWYIKEKNAPDSAYQLFSMGGKENGHEGDGWHGSVTSLNCNNPKPCFLSVKLVVTDVYGASDQVIRDIEIVEKNSPPVANFEPNKSRFEALELVSFTNLSYDLDNDNLVSHWYIKEKNAPDSAYQLFSMGGKENGHEGDGWHGTVTNLNCNYDRICYFDIKLVVSDATGLTDQITKQIEVYIKNTEPAACMQIPSPIFINDIFQIKNCATDTEGDPLQIRYVLEMPQHGVYLDFYVGHQDIRNGDLWLWLFTYPRDIGEWKITQYVSDGMHTVSTSGTFQVLDQTVQGQVQHTEQWLRNIQNFNSNFNSKMNPGKQFNLNPNKSLLEFFKGERFILKASETGRAKEITVKIAEYPQFQTTLTENMVDLWEGNLWNEAMFYTFKDKEVLTFVFEATFSNDWKAKSTVQIRIRDDNYFTQHTSY